MDTLELKVPEAELEAYLLKVRPISNIDKPKMKRKSKHNKASKQQQTITAKPSELQAIKRGQVNFYGEKYFLSK